MKIIINNILYNQILLYNNIIMNYKNYFKKL